VIKKILLRATCIPHYLKRKWKEVKLLLGCKEQGSWWAKTLWLQWLHLSYYYHNWTFSPTSMNFNSLGIISNFQVHFVSVKVSWRDYNVLEIGVM
jgi:hypothetical protein